jgi:hypothetical protein
MILLGLKSEPMCPEAEATVIRLANKPKRFTLLGSYTRHLRWSIATMLPLSLRLLYVRLQQIVAAAGLVGLAAAIMRVSYVVGYHVKQANESIGP